MLKYWYKITDIGITDAMSMVEARPIIVTNAVTFLFIVMLIVYSPLIYALQNWALMPLHLLAMALLVHCLWLNYKKKYFLSQYLGIIYGNGIIFGFVIFSGREPGLYYFCLITTILPFYINKLSNYKTIIVQTIIGILTFAISIYWANKYGALLELNRTYIIISSYLAKLGIISALIACTYYIFLLNSRAEDQLIQAQHKSDLLLSNILPDQLVKELQEKGFVHPKVYESVTVLFSDFVGFTTLAQKMKANDLVKELDTCFSRFDDIASFNHVEKLKTIGDAYMCAGGLPIENKSHIFDVCFTALQMMHFMDTFKQTKLKFKQPVWSMRIGIHTGSVLAGVIGKKKFNYDVWGDTVNIASRMESSGMNGYINISKDIYDVINPYFICKYRGKRSIKNRGQLKMYYLKRIKSEYSNGELGIYPNETLMSKISMSPDRR